ncbi:MAG: DNA polymerase ligase N-terminal domain-containing protein [Chthoniobacterales bacterium]
MNTGSLKTYREKRNFRLKPEPEERSKKSNGKKPIFTVQKHAARQLHYDFRLQVGRKLKSWAVPKGPSVDPKDKRMAVEVEDHPLAYANFEGVIPEGEYGAGTVMVWDTGTFRNISKQNHKEVPITQALESGQVAVWLQGKRLKGGYALRRIVAGKKPRWLLIKMRDEEADSRRNLSKIETKSALSGRTMKQIREEAEASQGSLLN